MPARYILRLTFCAKLARLGRERHAAAAPERSAVSRARRGRCPSASTASWSVPLTSDRGLLRLRAGATARCLVGDDDLVDQRFVEFAAEQRVGHRRRVLGRCH